MTWQVLKKFILIWSAVLPLSCMPSCLKEELQTGPSSDLQTPGPSENDSQDAEREWIPVPSDSLCTRDINAYGHPSMCGCPDSYTYDPKQRACFTPKNTVGKKSEP